MNALAKFEVSARIGNSQATDSFSGKVAKLKLGSIDDPNLGIEAQYNPGELQIDQSFDWSDHQDLNAKSTDALQQEFAGMQGRTATVELLFDGFEHHRSVKPQIETLRAMASVRDTSSTADRDQRPHHCVMTYAGETLRCVITSLTVKYTMFAKDGRPLRATASVSLKQAQRVFTRAR